jgi:hypothetical protein
MLKMIFLQYTITKLSRIHPVGQLLLKIAQIWMIYNGVFAGSTIGFAFNWPQMTIVAKAHKKRQLFSTWFVLPK